MFSVFLIFTFFTTVLLFVGLTATTGQKNTHKREKNALSLRDQQLAQSFSRRILAPIATGAVSLAARIGPANYVDRLQHRLVLAGSPRDIRADDFLAIKALCILAASVFTALLATTGTLGGGGSAKTALMLLPAGYFVPDLWLSSRIRDRQKKVRLSLPDVLDLLTISVEAGVGFDSALAKVVRNHRGPLSEEFFRMLREMRLGVTRREAFKNLNHRTGVPELSSFILSMLQADIFGISVSKVLRVQAKEMRIRRRQSAEEIAMKAPVKMVFPLVLCIFPALLIVILGPAGINIYRALSTGL
ncbi:MAG: type II secretion system F family protein [Terriglobia bacterium]